MWKIPHDTPQTATSNGATKLQEVTTQTPLDEVFKHWENDGGLIIKNLLSAADLAQLDTELTPMLERVRRGSLMDHPALQAFHGRKTKRAGDIINHSRIFREKVLDNDFLHAICKRCYSQDGHAGDYWLAAATTLNAGGPQDGQMLHRDMGSYPPYALLGPSGTESQINFLIATTKFRGDNGATRIIPGSNKWEFDQRGTLYQTVPAEMDAGDCLLISGKVVHGMGENKTDEERGCIQMSVCASFLTPAEAHPFIVTRDTASMLSRRVQRFIGFRSQYPRGSPGLWTKDYTELALHLGFDGPEGLLEDMREVLASRPDQESQDQMAG